MAMETPGDQKRNLEPDPSGNRIEKHSILISSYVHNSAKETTFSARTQLYQNRHCFLS